MADLLTKLQDFLRDKTSRPFSFETGEDCGLFPGDWVLWARGGEDPAAGVRGTYSDEAGAMALVEAAGGFVAFIEQRALAAGLKETAFPQDGDIGVVDLPKTGLTGAVMTNGAWAFRTRKGIAWSKVTPGRLMKAWSLDA